MVSNPNFSFKIETDQKFHNTYAYKNDFTQSQSAIGRFKAAIFHSKDKAYLEHSGFRGTSIRLEELLLESINYQINWSQIL